MWTKLIFIIRILFKLKHIGPEVKEAIAAIKAVEIDGVNDRKELEKAFSECLDVAEILIPGIKQVAGALKK